MRLHILQLLKPNTHLSLALRSLSPRTNLFYNNHNHIISIIHTNTNTNNPFPVSRLFWLLLAVPIQIQLLRPFNERPVLFRTARRLNAALPGFTWRCMAAPWRKLYVSLFSMVKSRYRYGGVYGQIRCGRDWRVGLSDNFNLCLIDQRHVRYVTMGRVRL